MEERRRHAEEGRKTGWDGKRRADETGKEVTGNGAIEKGPIT